MDVRPYGGQVDEGLRQSALREFIYDRNFRSASVYIYGAKASGVIVGFWVPNSHCWK
jgi:hypothetical protein